MLHRLIKKKRYLFPALAGAAAVLIAAVYFAAGGNAVKVEKATVEYRDVKDTYTEEGTVSFGDSYQIISEVSGAVKELAVRENDLVQKGDLLYRIDFSAYIYLKSQAENALESYRAKREQSRFGQLMTAAPTEYLASLSQELAAARAAMQTAATAYEAARSLYAAGDIARVEFEKISAEYKNASARYEQTKARSDESTRYLEELKNKGMTEEELNRQFYDSESRQLDAMISDQETTIAHLEEEISKCEVHSDRDGRITEFPVSSLSGVQQGQVTAVLQGTENAGAETDVLTTIAPYLYPGAPAEGRISLRGADEVYPFVVTDIYDFAAKGVSALGLDEYRVHIRAVLPENADPAVREQLLKREGYGVDLTFTLFEGKHVLTVPSGAVFSQNGGDYVFAIEDKRAVRRQVRILHRAAGEIVLDEEKSEVHDGDTVINRVDSEGIYEGARIK